MKTKSIITLATGLCLALIVSARGQASFTKITTGPIVTDRGQFAGAAWADFHGLGFLDLMVCDYGGGTNVFYRNNGDGTFAKITQGDPVQRAAYSVDPAAADFDNDGHLDLLVTAGAGATTAKRNMLCRNNGDGTFTAVSGGGVTNFMGFFNTCAVADYDNDGFVDLYIPGLSGATSLLFHNNGDGTFSRVLSGAPILSMNNYSVSWADYDGDGFIDLLVNVDNRNYLFHNNRDGTFTRILTNAVATDLWPDNPWGSAWGDLDNKGLLDLFVTGMTAGNRLYHNNGNSVFTNVTSGPMLSPPTGGVGVPARLAITTTMATSICLCAATTAPTGSSSTMATAPSPKSSSAPRSMRGIQTFIATPAASRITTTMAALT